MGLKEDIKHSYNVDKKQTLSNKNQLKPNNLSNIRRHLKKYDLLNNKYLIKRNEIYYFVFYFEKDINKQFSLKTSNFLLANILKYKIIASIEREIRKMGNEELFNFDQTKTLTVTATDETLNISAVNEEENQLVKEITEKTIRSIQQRKIKNVKGTLPLKARRKSKTNIKKHVDLYIKYLKRENKNKKTVEGYIKKFDILIDYFNYINVYSLTDITKKQCRDLQSYLLVFPSNMNKYEELKNKNIFELIDNEDKILDKYEKISKRTVDNYITRYKTIFNYFIDNDYAFNNYFLTIKNLKPKVENPITQFQLKEDIREQFDKEEIEYLLNNIKVKEIKDLIVLSTITGARIHELVNLKPIDIINLNNNYHIDITKSKTPNGIRKIPIHRKFNFLIKRLLEKKNTYLLFNDVKGERVDIVQKRTMYQIRKFIKNKNKVFHSFRKNFTQELYKSNIEELYIKLLLGHSLKDNLSFNVYNLAKIDNATLREEINKVNFKELFENTEYDIRNIERISDNEERLITSIKETKISMNL